MDHLPEMPQAPVVVARRVKNRKGMGYIPVISTMCGGRLKCFDLTTLMAELNIKT